jgi:hypothetical protein
MSGTPEKVTPMPTKVSIKTMLVTPELATSLLEHNTLNRPLSDLHVKRIAAQIIEGKWVFNGDTIKISSTNDVIDGQHRLWAIIESKIAVESVIIRGVDKKAFATIDTLRKPRSGADILSLKGATRYRARTASALQWLIRWQKGTLEDYRAPANRIENSDIEHAFEENPMIVRAVERANNLRSLCNSSILGFIYYVLANRNEALGERLLETLTNPAGVAVNDPIFRLRAHFATRTEKHRDPLVTIALIIKALNAAHRGDKISTLVWKGQGKNPEPFPKLKV